MLFMAIIVAQAAVLETQSSQEQAALLMLLEAAMYLGQCHIWGLLDTSFGPKKASDWVVLNTFLLWKHTSFKLGWTIKQLKMVSVAVTSFWLVGFSCVFFFLFLAGSKPSRFLAKKLRWKNWTRGRPPPQPSRSPTCTTPPQRPRWWENRWPRPGQNQKWPPFPP